MQATDWINNIALKVSNWALEGASGRMHDKEFLEREINDWKVCPARLAQIKGELYYNGDHDICRRERTMIGDDGQLQTIDNLPNNRIIDNQYAKLVDQKTDYLLGQPFVFDSPNDRYSKALKGVFDKRFMKMLKNAGRTALNTGIAWLYPSYDLNGRFSFRCFPGYEILPFWADTEHTELDYAVRLYTTLGVDGNDTKVIEKVEVYDLDGVHRFILDGGTLIPDIVNEQSPDAFHVVYTDGDTVTGFNWSKVPLIPIKYQENEMPLLNRVKSLQDGINIMLSDFENNMQEDARNTILVLKNYDGQNLGEFRKNLATYGAVKVRYDGDTKGGVETLEVNVNADNYKQIIDIFKKALIENGMGYDAKDDRLSGTPNQMNIQSMYSDIDLDANDMETELQATFESILWFIDAHLANTGQGSFDGEPVNIIFNRDMMMDEGSIINNIRNSVGILSMQTLIAQHPWVTDVDDELRKIAEEEQQNNIYGDFGMSSEQ